MIKGICNLVLLFSFPLSLSPPVSHLLSLCSLILLSFFFHSFLVTAPEVIRAGNKKPQAADASCPALGFFPSPGIRSFHVQPRGQRPPPQAWPSQPGFLLWLLISCIPKPSSASLSESMCFSCFQVQNHHSGNGNKHLLYVLNPGASSDTFCMCGFSLTDPKREIESYRESYCPHWVEVTQHACVYLYYI